MGQQSSNQIVAGELCFYLQNRKILFKVNSHTEIVYTRYVIKGEQL